MPKIVDHEQRRGEIADALYRVIVRAGIEGASVRAVAAEAGWSMGALRHYFATQEELLNFGVELQLERIPVQISRIVDEHPRGRSRAELIVGTLLPLDDERLVEMGVWLAALARSQHDPALDAVRRQGWDGEQYICRGVICELLDKPWPDTMEIALPARREAEATRLHVLVHGLGLAGAAFVDRMSSAEISRIVRHELRELHKRLS